jgi:hypothetical protein
LGQRRDDWSLDGLRLIVKPTYQSVHGMLMPHGFPRETLASSFEFTPEADDVVLATYPKCGTTWMQNILYMLFHEGREIPSDQSVMELVPHLEEMGADFVRARPRPRLIKTHLQSLDSLWLDSARYVLVFRNPFDCVVSFFHHTRGFVRHYDFADGTFEDYLPLFVAGEVDFGDYFEHAVSWLSVCERDNVFWTTYERMKADLDAEIARLAAFLGGAAGSAADDSALRERIVAASSFSSMAKNQQRWSSKRPDGMTEFVRKGIVGDWRRHFTPETMQPLLASSEQSLAGTVLAAEWSDIFREAQLFCEN